VEHEVELQLVRASRKVLLAETVWYVGLRTLWEWFIWNIMHSCTLTIPQNTIWKSDFWKSGEQLLHSGDALLRGINLLTNLQGSCASWKALKIFPISEGRVVLEYFSFWKILEIGDP